MQLTTQIPRGMSNIIVETSLGTILPKREGTLMQTSVCSFTPLWMGTFGNHWKHTMNLFLTQMSKLLGTNAEGMSWTLWVNKIITVHVHYVVFLDGNQMRRQTEELFPENTDFIKSVWRKSHNQDNQFFTSEASCPSTLIESRLSNTSDVSMNEHMLSWAIDMF